MMHGVRSSQVRVPITMLCSTLESGSCRPHLPPKRHSNWILVRTVKAPSPSLSPATLTTTAVNMSAGAFGEANMLSTVPEANVKDVKIYKNVFIS